MEQTGPEVEVPGQGRRRGVVREEVHLVSGPGLALSPQVGVKTPGDWIEYPDGSIGLLDPGEISARDGLSVIREAWQGGVDIRIPVEAAGLCSQEGGEAPGPGGPLGAAADQDDGSPPPDVLSLKLSQGKVAARECGLQSDHLY